jgi:diguanylate cyclase (GGDEF)-like protein
LDEFKLVNDRHGHFAGDEAIQRFASILNANTRACDICGRSGGDEFLLVMSHGEKDATVQTIERLRADWEKERFVFNGRELQVTACSASRAIVVSENRTFVSCSLEPITRYTQLRQPDIIE